MNGKMITIYPNGSHFVRAMDRRPTLEELQEAVEGLIELVPFFDQYEGEPCVAYCNEEGKLEGKPFNSVATEAWHKLRRTGDVLVGNVIVLIGDKEFLE